MRRTSYLSVVMIVFAVGLVGSFKDENLIGPRGTLERWAERVCEATHPVEIWSPHQGRTCVRQHIIQNSSEWCKRPGGEDECNARTVWWSEIRHYYTDYQGGYNGAAGGPSKSGFVEDEPQFWAFTTDNRYNLLAAYRLGVYGTQWSTLFFDYDRRGNWQFVSFRFDGVSNVLYFWSWLINIPQKTINNAVYVADKEPRLLIDVLFEVVMLPFECAVAIAATSVGVIIGTIFHPINTILAIPGGVWLALIAMWQAIYLLVVSIWSIIVFLIVEIF
jgi:hypothetical protein